MQHFIYLLRENQMDMIKAIHLDILWLLTVHFYPCKLLKYWGTLLEERLDDLGEKKILGEAYSILLWEVSWYFNFSIISVELELGWKN